MNYVSVELQKHLEEKLYRVYMANSMYGIGHGEVLKHKYSDLLNNDIPDEDTRTGDEIAADVISRLGLRFEE